MHILRPFLGGKEILQSFPKQTRVADCWLLMVGILVVAEFQKCTTKSNHLHLLPVNVTISNVPKCRGDEEVNEGHIKWTQARSQD